MCVLLLSFTFVIQVFTSYIAMEQKFKCRLVMGEKKNWQFLYLFDDKMLYKKNAPSKNGYIYRCVHEKCPARIRQKSDVDCVKLATAKPHNHSENDEQRYTNLLGNERMVTMAMDLHAIAGGSGITSSREIHKQALIE